MKKLIIILLTVFILTTDVQGLEPNSHNYPSYGGRNLENCLDLFTEDELNLDFVKDVFRGSDWSFQNDRCILRVIEYLEDMELLKDQLNTTY